MTTYCTRKRSIPVLAAALALIGPSVLAAEQRPEVQRLFQSGSYEQAVDAARKRLDQRQPGDVPAQQSLAEGADPRPDLDDVSGSRLGELIEEHNELPFDELRERIVREVRAFAGGAAQHDDMTFILLRVDEVPARQGRQDETDRVLVS